LSREEIQQTKAKGGGKLGGKEKKSEGQRIHILRTTVMQEAQCLTSGKGSKRGKRKVNLSEVSEKKKDEGDKKNSGNLGRTTLRTVGKVDELTNGERQQEDKNMVRGAEEKRLGRGIGQEG